MSGKRQDLIGRHVGAAPRFITGMLMLPPYLMIDNLLYKLILAAFFAALALLAGKRIRWGYFLILISSVTFFHLLTPCNSWLSNGFNLRIALPRCEIAFFSSRVN